MNELRAFRRAARGHRVFLDIGAAQGIFSAAFCALTGGLAYAFEPSPEMFEELMALIDQNPGLKITPCEIALGAAAGGQRVQHFGSQFRGVNSTEGDDVTMAVETLDDFVEYNELAPDFAKVDVEGMELEVLRGGANTFSQLVDVIMLEIHPGVLMRGEKVSELQSMLLAYGFTLFTLDFAPIPDLASYTTRGREALRPATNIVCAKGRPELDSS